MPLRKWALVTIVLLPPLVAQSGSMSADAMTNGAISLFLAAVLYYRERNKGLSAKDWLFLAAAASVMSLSKQISFIFLPLVLLVPAGLPEGRSLIRRYGKRALVAAPASILAAAWYMKIHTLHIGIAGGSSEATSQQISYILAQPFEYFLTFLRTYFMGYGDSIYSSLIGSFGWDVTVSLGAIIAGYFLIWYALWYRDDEAPIRPLSIIDTVIVAATGLLYVGGVSTALYVGFTQYKQKYIQGVQGRYLYPLLMLLTPFSGAPTAVISGLKYRKTIQIGSVSLLTFCALMVYLRYYVKYL